MTRQGIAITPKKYTIEIGTKEKSVSLGLTSGLKI